MRAGLQKARVVLSPRRQRGDHALGQTRAIDHEVEGQDQHDQQLGQERRRSGGEPDDVAQNRWPERVGPAAEILWVQR